MGGFLAYQQMLDAVNPLIDGMNLAAKEGPVVNQLNEVLVLSRTTGAFQEMCRASPHFTDRSGGDGRGPLPGPGVVSRRTAPQSKIARRIVTNVRIRSGARIDRSNDRLYTL